MGTHDFAVGTLSLVAWDPGLSALFVGIGQATGYDLVALRNLDPGAWLGLCEVALGGGALAAALLLVVRRDQD